MADIKEWNVEDNEFSELEKKVADLQAERDAIRRRSAT